MHDRLRELQWVDLFPNWNEGITKLTQFLGNSSVQQSSKSMESINNKDVRSYLLLRFDGLYQSDQKNTQHNNSYWKNLRFYDDGSLVTVSTAESDCAVIEANFSKEDKSYFSYGMYKLVGRNISFSATSKTGIVDYEGTIEGDAIILKHHSHINGNRGVTQYDFKPI